MHNPFTSRTGRACRTTVHGLLKAVVSLVLFAGTATSWAQWPAAPIKIIVPYAPGSAPDVAMRPLAASMARNLGASIVIENRPGASGIIGMQALMRSEPDGYTLGFGNVVSLAINAGLYPDLPYNPVKDFAPISLAIGNANALMVRKDLPFSTVQELLDYARQNPEKLLMGSAGIGSTGHLSGMMMQQKAGVKMVHVPYKNGLDGLSNLVGGDIDIMFENMALALPYIRDGKVNVVAVTSAVRAQALPQVPTLLESGVDVADFVAWGGLIAPAGTAPEIIAKLNQSVHQALQDPEVIRTNETLAVEVMPSTPEAFHQRIERELPQWRDIIQISGASTF
ncbi:Bug family tripartite tricarboxylate transporter substrate binding protein [Alcaligenes phenolicus]|uniref:Tripartite tricarboxylate transporter substrate binding protein n=1 Tax=Alcaligenes phenolicus TaxID=232846 RepID=A0AAW5W0R7_9BURK|nr:tripartite tricarboxylate transporter substrate binding protein [Alcaligenes phenolicus]MCX5567102.1 tripartite tricarboxylate transporter substrate binding protein [Alcaligenes phenolicus]